VRRFYAFLGTLRLDGGSPADEATLEIFVAELQRLAALQGEGSARINTSFTSARTEADRTVPR
jgi:hypothetical protein